MTPATGQTPMLSYNIEEIVSGVDKNENGQAFKQNICLIKVPEIETSNIEAFVASKNLNTIPNLPGKIDWGYLAGRPLMYVEVTKRLSGEELNVIERAIREKGLETFGSRLS